MATMKIALAGNPNCGKTTLLNDLTGSGRYVGNRPGVTVEKKGRKVTRMWSFRIYPACLQQNLLRAGFHDCDGRKDGTKRETRGQ